MATIFKRTRDKGKKNSPYYVAYTDHDGKRRMVKGFSEKGLTEQLAAKLENEVMLRTRGLIDPAQEKLAEIRKMPIAAPLKAYEASLTDNTEGYVELVMSRIRRIIDGCAFTTIGDLGLVDIHVGKLPKPRKMTFGFAVFATVEVFLVSEIPRSTLSIGKCS